MAAAYILAGELSRANGDYVQAFARYQDLFAPFVLNKQKAALRFAGAFDPRSRTSASSFAIRFSGYLRSPGLRTWLSVETSPTTSLSPITDWANCRLEVMFPDMATIVDFPCMWPQDLLKPVNKQRFQTPLYRNDLHNRV